jgi:hypothetical protein
MHKESTSTEAVAQISLGKKFMSLFCVTFVAVTGLKYIGLMASPQDLSLNISITLVACAIVLGADAIKRTKEKKHRTKNDENSNKQEGEYVDDQIPWGD